MKRGGKVTLKINETNQGKQEKNTEKARKKIILLTNENKHKNIQVKTATILLTLNIEGSCGLHLAVSILSDALVVTRLTPLDGEVHIEHSARGHRLTPVLPDVPRFRVAGGVADHLGG